MDHASDLLAAAASMTERQGTGGLFFREANPGGAPCVLLIHGLGASDECWGYQMPELTAAGFLVVAPDLPGFGRSPWTPTNGVAGMAASVAGLMQELGVRRAHVAGISMGGTVALQLALDHAEMVDHLVLVSTFARLRPDRLSGWINFGVRVAMTRVLGMRTQASAVAARLFPRPQDGELRRAFIEQFLQAEPRAYRSAIGALGRFNVLSRLGEVRAPTLIATGSEDHTISPLNQHQLLAIPRSRQVTLEGAGHGLIADHAEEFNKLLLDFLECGKSGPAIGDPGSTGAS